MDVGEVRHVEEILDDAQARGADEHRAALYPPAVGLFGLGDGEHVAGGVPSVVQAYPKRSLTGISAPVAPSGEHLAQTIVALLAPP